LPDRREKGWLAKINPGGCAHGDGPSSQRPANTGTESASSQNANQTLTSQRANKQV
jgi:hypothetical protein